MARDSLATLVCKVTWDARPRAAPEPAPPAACRGAEAPAASTTDAPERLARQALLLGEDGKRRRDGFESKVTRRPVVARPSSFHRAPASGRTARPPRFRAFCARRRGTLGPRRSHGEVAARGAQWGSGVRYRGVADSTGTCRAPAPEPCRPPAPQPCLHPWPPAPPSPWPGLCLPVAGHVGAASSMGTRAAVAARPGEDTAPRTDAPSRAEHTGLQRRTLPHSPNGTPLLPAPQNTPWEGRPEHSTTAGQNTPGLPQANGD